MSERDAYNDTYASCRDTYATLRIFGDDLDPEEVTKLLGTKPTRSFRKGDLKHPNSKRPRSRELKFKTGGWLLSSEGQVKSKDVRRHVDWLLHQVEAKRDVLKDLLSQSCEMGVFCYWESRYGQGGPSLAPQQMKRLAGLGLSIWFDVYFSEESDS